MKGVLVAFLLLVVLLLVTVDAKKRGKEGSRRKNGIKPGMKELTCPRNCSDCEEGICLECDDGFALKTFRNNRTGCIPCGRRLKMKDPASFLQQCINDCSRNCSVCDNGNCQMCDPGFFKVQTRLLKRTVCVPCGPRMKRNWPDVFVKECTESGCGRGCANCTSPGLCTECEGDQKLFTPPGSNIIRCVRRCPLFYKLEKGASPPTCEFQHKGGKPNRQNGKCGRGCEQCTEEGVCEKCFKELQFLKLRDRTICVRKCPSTLRKYFDPETNKMICGNLRRGKKGGRKNPLLSDI